MDKSKIAVIIIVLVMVVLVAGVIFTSSGDSNLSSDELLSIGENVYTVKECKDYIKITNEAEGDITKVNTDEEKEEIVNQFLQEKIYASAAMEKGITVPESEIEDFKEDYAEKSVYAENGISEADYIKYASDNYLYTQLSQNLQDYYELPAEYYDALIESVEEPLKTYSFRVMTFYYEDPVSGDVSGEIIEDEHDHEHEHELEEISEEKLRDAVYAKAEDIRNQVINSGDFEKLAQENSSYRYTFNGASYTLVNGNIEYASSILLQDKLGSEELYNAVKDLSSGECSVLVEDEEANVINFVKVETVEEGITGEAEAELKEILLYQYQDTLVTGDTHYHMNQSALLRVYYK